MDEKHGEDSDSYISARARQGLTFDCEVRRQSVFGSVERTRILRWGRCALQSSRNPRTPEELRAGDREA